MELTVDRFAPSPMYRQLADQIREAITARELEPGDQLPTEGELVTQTGASRTAVREAVQVLANEGLVIKRSGRATRVAPVPPVRRLDADRYIKEMRILRAGGEHPRVSQFASDHGVPLDEVGIDADYDRERATAADAGYLGVTVGSTILRRRFLKYVDGEPVEIQRSAVPLRIARGTVLEDPTVQPYPGGTQAELWAAGCKNLERITNEITARMPTNDERRLLRLDAIVPVFDMVRVFWEGKSQVEASRVIAAANRVVLLYETNLNVAE